MPIYEYTCRKCDKSFEKLVRSMSSSEPVNCPSCHSTETARKLSVFAAVASTSPAKSTPTPICGRCNAPGPCATGF